MSKLKELQRKLDGRAGVDIKESKGDHTAEILNLKLKLERISNGLRAIRGQPRSSPLLRESLQRALDTRGGAAGIDQKAGKTDWDMLNESISALEVIEPELKTYDADVRCLQCGWSGTISVEKGLSVKFAACPNCGCIQGGKTCYQTPVLVRENNSSASLQSELDARASVESSDIRESVTIDLAESNYENNAITFTLAEGNPEDLVGKKIYVNRQTWSEKKQLPERDLKDWVATITEAIQKAGKIVAKAFIHDEKIHELLTNPVSKKAMGITMDGGNLCFVTEGGKELT
ncbi:MAG: hypothetical protein WC510_02020 [Candidatus Omnitrophota bacterium]